MTTYYSLPTPAGEAELAGALAAQQTVPFTHIAIGDGNGAPVIPDGRTALVHQVDEVQITSIRQHPVHANWIILEAAVPEDRGGYVVRELAVKGGRTPGTVLAVGNHPAVEKPAPDSGAAEAMILRMVVAFEHGTAAISLAIDPMAYATLQTVLDQIAAHEAKADPHPQYLTKAEGDSAYDAAGAAAAAVATAGNGLAAHLAAPDPHPQYLTKAEGDAAYDAAGAAAAALAGAGDGLAAHVAAANPHAQYQTKAEATNAWAEQFFYAAGT
ncbi:phage-related tail fiber protein [Duganella sp. SG902]|uniref:phage tail protein n=1 Tax=Duganella sp. SG902 TaxID=2587016 RepID=UPI00159E4457|nr:phage tail protein [Duganella sp. SG902]NVM80051.1 phage-related tail fiber protein [Duganella sp. SG902]